MIIAVDLGRKATKQTNKQKDLAGHVVGPDLGPNWLQRLSADDFDIVCHQNVIQINSPGTGDNSEEILLSFVQPRNNRIARPTD